MESQKPLLYLHIGYPKTGSSSIQNFCYRNKALLLEKGTCYPDPRPEGLLRNFNVGHIFCCDSLKYTNYVVPDWRKVRQHYMDEMLESGCPENLLSSEQFLFEHSDTLAFWQERFTIHGICYFRTLFDYLGSLQKEFIKECLRPDVFTFTLFRNHRILGSLKYLIGATGGPGNWTFRDFDAVRASETGLIPDFMRIIGVDDLAGFAPVKAQNLTPPDAQLTFLYQLSFVPFDYEQAFSIRRDVTHMALPEGRGFRNNFLPADIYALDDYATWAVNFQGELLGRPDWLERTVERGRELARIPYRDLPPGLQWDIFERLSGQSQDILRKFLLIPPGGRSEPFLPSMRNVEEKLPMLLPLWARYISLLGEQLKSRMKR